MEIIGSTEENAVSGDASIATVTEEERREEHSSLRHGGTGVRHHGKNCVPISMIQKDAFGRMLLRVRINLAARLFVLLWV